MDPIVNNTFEQPKIGQNKRKTDDLASVCPEMLRIVDNVRIIIQRQNGYIYIPDLRNFAVK